MCNEVHHQGPLHQLNYGFIPLCSSCLLCFLGIYLHIGGGAKTHMHAEARRKRQMTLDLELQVLVSYLTSVLGTEVKFSAKAASALNYPAIFPAPQVTSRTISVLPIISWGNSVFVMQLWDLQKPEIWKKLNSLHGTEKCTSDQQQDLRDSILRVPTCHTYEWRLHSQTAEPAPPLEGPLLPVHTQ